MGIRNSAQSFQKMLNYVLDGLDNIFCYLDDILIFSENEHEHLKTIEELFKRLQDNGLTINRKKCNFGRETLTFLGYTVSGTGIKPVKKKLEAIANFPPPGRPKELLGFLGAANYYRRSLPKLQGRTAAEIMQPLYQAATKKRPAKKFADIWKEEGLQRNFDDVKTMLMLACKLVHPDPAAPLALTVDSSNYAIGGTIEQFNNNKWEPLGYWSRHLQPNQKMELFSKRAVCYTAGH